jgi:hypothetical protein
MRDLTLGAALLVLAVTAGACNKNATAEECEKLADHITELAMAAATAGLGPNAPGVPAQTAALTNSLAQMVREQRPGYVAQCTRGMPRAAYDCMMRATTVKALADCRGK